MPDRDDGREGVEPLVERGVLHAEGAHGIHEGEVGAADRGQGQHLARLVLARPRLEEHLGDRARADPAEPVDDAQRADDVVEADAEEEALGDLAVVDLDAELPHRQAAERLGDDERHLGLEVRGELADVDDVDVGLGELAEAPLLRPLPAPDLLDLVAAEREGEPAGVLEHVAGERHGEVEVQAQRGIPAAVVAREPADAVDLLVGVAALAEQPLDRLDGPGLERREPVQLEDLADDVEEVQLEEPLGGQELGEPGDRGHLGGGRVHAVNPRR